MPSITLRAALRPLALAFVALATLGGCADEPIAPDRPSALATRPSLQPLNGGQVTVTSTSGGTEVGSIRWAASQLAQDGGTIVFDPSLAGATITLQAELELDDLIAIIAPASKGITLSGNDQHRVILANNGVVLRNVTVTKGNALYASAIWSEGSLHLENSTVHDNRGSGAAVHAGGYSATLVNSTISGNVVGISALEYRNGATVALHNSTIAHNGPAAGLSTYHNASESPTRVYLRNSIISHNGSPLRNCSNTLGFVYEGMNIANDQSCGNTTGIVTVDPLLLPLADNGGPTMTHAISHLSPALDAGSSCSEETDQRYVPRDAVCDIGAFEFTDFTIVTITIDPNASVSSANGSVTITGTAKCSRNESESIGLNVQVSQTQKVGKTTKIVRGSGGVGAACTTTAQGWSATIAPSSGAFQNGSASVTLQTNDTPVWVKPAAVSAAVKLAVRRK